MTNTMTILTELRNIHREVSLDLLEGTVLDIYLDNQWLYMATMLGVGTASVALTTTLVYGVAVLCHPVYLVSATFLPISGVGVVATSVGLGFLGIVVGGYALYQMLAVPITAGIYLLSLVRKGLM